MKEPVRLESPTRTYAANLRIRRETSRFARTQGGVNPMRGHPIPGVRSFATIQRKLRSQGKRAARKQQEEVQKQLQERKGALYA